MEFSSRLKLAELLFNFPSAAPVFDIALEALNSAFALDAFLQTAACPAEGRILPNVTLTVSESGLGEANDTTDLRRRRIGQKSFVPSPT